MLSAVETSLGHPCPGLSFPRLLSIPPLRRGPRAPVVPGGTFGDIQGHSTPATPAPVRAGPQRRSAVTDQRTRPCRDGERDACQRFQDAGSYSRLVGTPDLGYEWGRCRNSWPKDLPELTRPTGRPSVNLSLALNDSLLSAQRPTRRRAIHPFPAECWVRLGEVSRQLFRVSSLACRRKASLAYSWTRRASIQPSTNPLKTSICGRH